MYKFAFKSGACPSQRTFSQKRKPHGRQHHIQAKKRQTEQVPEKLENPNFLQQLQNGTASLYSTFEGDGIGAALALNVDGEGKSYIIIDYKNLKILQERENETLNIL